jgi:UDP-N-acetylglucosamine 2-epimerase
LKALKNKNINAIVSAPNTDPGNRKIFKVIEKYKNDKDFVFYKSLERDIFLSIYKQSDFIIGNSSSGVVEAASIPIPAVNVGLRQVGRYSGDNIVFCDIDIVSIEKAIEKVINKDFLNALYGFKNPYGDGNSSVKAYEIIKKTDFKKFLLKKEDALELSYE